MSAAESTTNFSSHTYSAYRGTVPHRRIHEWGSPMFIPAVHNTFVPVQQLFDLCHSTIT